MFPLLVFYFSKASKKLNCLKIYYYYYSYYNNNNNINNYIIV